MHKTLLLCFGSGARQSEENLREVPQVLPSLAPEPQVRRGAQGRQMTASGLPQDRPPVLTLMDGKEEPQLKNVFMPLA